MADGIGRTLQQLRTSPLSIIGTNEKDLKHSAYSFTVYENLFPSDDDRQTARVVPSTMLQKQVHQCGTLAPNLNG
jgi:hypothetical protein